MRLSMAWLLSVLSRRGQFPEEEGYSLAKEPSAKSGATPKGRVLVRHPAWIPHSDPIRPFCPRTVL